MSAAKKPLEKKGYTYAEAAALFSVSVKRIQIARRENELVARYPFKGDEPRFDGDDLQRWWDSLPTEPPSERTK